MPRPRCFWAKVIYATASRSPMNDDRGELNPSVVSDRDGYRFVGYTTYRWASLPGTVRISASGLEFRPGRLLRVTTRVPSIRHVAKEVTVVRSRTLYSSSSLMIVLHDERFAVLSGSIFRSQEEVMRALANCGYDTTVVDAPWWIWWFYPLRWLYAKRIKLIP